MNKGSALLLTLLVVAALSAIAIGISKLSLGEIKLVKDIPKSIITYYAAEAGMEQAMYIDWVQGSPSNFNGSLSPGVYYSVTFSGVTPNRTITSTGSHQDIIRAIELSY